MLELRDSGQGMDEATLVRAVEPFFSTKPGHLGVGLSIANGIWRRHRGTLLDPQPARRRDPGSPLRRARHRGASDVEPASSGLSVAEQAARVDVSGSGLESGGSAPAGRCLRLREAGP